MRLLIGLGNPGSRYSGNRHNIGFMLADAIARAYPFSSFLQKFGGLLAEGVLAGEKTYLFKPGSFMNLSGEPAGELSRFYKIPLENIIALHDELDLPFGKLRIKRGGGHGGHNGLKSLDAHLGADYLRLRIGIGHPGDRDMVSPYVLSDFTPEEAKSLQPLINAMAEYTPLLLTGKEAEYMNKVTLATRPEQST